LESFGQFEEKAQLKLLVVMQDSGTEFIRKKYATATSTESKKKF
jgi:hypothetical protein